MMGEMATNQNRMLCFVLILLPVFLLVFNFFESNSSGSNSIIFIKHVLPALKD